MKVATGNALNILLVTISLSIVALRFACRIFYDRRAPIAADYVALLGWFCSLGLIICFAMAYHITPNNVPNSHHTSVDWLKITYASLFFYDIGLILPKVSITMFYWWLIPPTSTLRYTLWGCTIYVSCAFVGIFLSDLLFCLPISDNWSVANQLNSVWNSPTNITVNWALNISSDCILFLMPLAIYKSIKLGRAQRLTLMGVCSFGLITITVSTLRYSLPITNLPHVFPPDAALWYVAEQVTATCVVCLPSLKPLLVACARKLGMSGSTDKAHTGVSMNAYSSQRRGPLSRTPQLDPTRMSDDLGMAEAFHSSDAVVGPGSDEEAQKGVVMVVTEVTLSSAEKGLETASSSAAKDKSFLDGM